VPECQDVVRYRGNCLRVTRLGRKSRKTIEMMFSAAHIRRLNTVGLMLQRVTCWGSFSARDCLLEQSGDNSRGGRSMYNSLRAAGDECRAAYTIFCIPLRIEIEIISAFGPRPNRRRSCA